MTARLAIRSERVVTPDGVRPAVVVIGDDGRIAEVRFADVRIPDTPDALASAADDLAAAGVRVRDVGRDVVMPGAVDCHVHVNEPGRTEWEGFETATRAAAAGGVTAIVDMPLNCIPVTTTPEALAAKLAAIDGKLWVDAGFWGGVVPGNADRLEALIEAGALGCKAFLCHSGIDEFPGVGEADLRAAMRALARAGAPLLAHAELDTACPPGPGASGDPRAYATYLASRPAAWEDAAIALLIRLCRDTGCAVHVVHLSSAGSLPQLADARAEGLPVTVETCPHYLCLDAGQVPDGATTYKCAPPIRDRDNRDRLWQGLRDGVIDFVISDHSPCTPGLKRIDAGDFHEAWGGIASLQLGLSLLWTEARARGLTVPDVARWTAEAPARFAGLRRKGALIPGRDADLVIWDPDAEVEVRAEDLHIRHKVSPYVGRVLRGAVRATYVRGRLVYAGAGAGRARRSAGAGDTGPGGAEAIAAMFPAGPIGRPMLGRGDARAPS